MPIDDPIALGVDGYEAHPAGERLREVLPEREQQSPPMQERLKRPGAPSDPAGRRPPPGGAQAGAPRAGRPAVSRAPPRRSPGRAGGCASTFARVPPRLCPTIAARWPCSETKPLEALLQPRHQRARAVHVRRRCRRLGRYPARSRASLHHRRQRAVARQEAGDQQHRASAPSGMPSPRKIGSRSSAAASSADASLRATAADGITQRNEARNALIAVT